jgi:hypothetical protein
MADEKPPKDNRVPIMMSDAELGAIDNWRFENRIATRSEAIRRLCKIALFVDDKLDLLLEDLGAAANSVLDVVNLTEEPPPLDSWEFRLLDAVFSGDGGLIKAVGDLEELAVVTRPYRTAPSLQEAIEQAARERVLHLGRREDAQAEEKAARDEGVTKSKK